MRKFILVMFVLVSMSLGCAGLSFQVDPASGNYSVTVSAEDCISTENTIGSLVYSVPWIGPKAVAVFGCPPTGGVAN